MSPIKFLIVVTSVITLMSCEKDNKEKETSIEVSPTQITFTSGGPAQTFTIKSNTSWTISSDQTWCVISPASGNGNQEITVTVTTKATSTELMAKLTISFSSGAERTVSVTQGTVSIPNTIAGGGNERITISGTGANAKLVLTTDPNDAGLYFKFGSVIGIYSATGKNQTLPTTMVAYFSVNDMAFNPYANQNIAPIDISINGFGFDNPPSIPAYDATDFNAGKTNISDNAYHNLTNVRAGKGDPCRLIGMSVSEIKGFSDPKELYAREDALKSSGIGGWRLPTMEENKAFSGQIGVNANYSAHWWTTSDSPFGIPAVIGGEFPSKSNGGLAKFLPAAGMRESGNGKINYQGSGGYYWSSQSYGSWGFYLYFDDTEINPNRRINSSYGFSARCVRR